MILTWRVGAHVGFLFGRISYYWLERPKMFDILFNNKGRAIIADNVCAILWNVIRIEWMSSEITV